jgi:hypothetical protein
MSGNWIAMETVTSSDESGSRLDFRLISRSFGPNERVEIRFGVHGRLDEQESAVGDRIPLGGGHDSQ